MSQSWADVKQFPWGKYVIALFIILIIGFWPVFSILIASAIASANGCILNETGPNTCMINGQDWGELLYNLGGLGRLALVFVPLGLVSLLGWIYSLGFSLFSFYRKKRPMVPPL